jgi:hypothetical protein
MNPFFHDDSGKLQTYLAAGIPVVAMLNGEGRCRGELFRGSCLCSKRP